MSDQDKRASELMLGLFKERQKLMDSSDNSSNTGNRLKCSFCGKTQDQVAKLISGPGVYICNQCVGLCNEILDEELFESSAPREEVTTNDTLLLKIFRESENHIVRWTEDPKLGVQLFLNDTCIGTSVEERIMYVSAMNELIDRRLAIKCAQNVINTYFQLTSKGIARVHSLLDPPPPKPKKPPE